GDDQLDPGGVAGVLVLLTEGGCEVHDAGTRLGGDVVGREHHVGAGVPGEEVERRGVAQSHQLGALDGGHDLRVVAELGGVHAAASLGQDEQSAGELSGVDPDHRVVDLGMHGGGEVGR